MGSVVALIILSLWWTGARGALITGEASQPFGAAFSLPDPRVFPGPLLPETTLAPARSLSPSRLPWSTPASRAPLRPQHLPATATLQSLDIAMPLFPASFAEGGYDPTQRFDAVPPDSGMRLTTFQWSLAVVGVAGVAVYLLHWRRQRRFARAARRRRHIAIKGGGASSARRHARVAAGSGSASAEAPALAISRKGGHRRRRSSTASAREASASTGAAKKGETSEPHERDRSSGSQRRKKRGRHRSRRR